LPGTPDIVLRRYGVIVFVHGCFWHRHAKCPKATLPRTRGQFWSDKFRANRARDRRVASELHRLGWKVVIVWQCELKYPSRVKARLCRLIDRGAADVAARGA
jgi:DNA mismatch endonuclease (patch repair protein)